MKQHRILRRHFNMAKHLAHTYGALEEITRKNTSSTLEMYTLPALLVEINRLLKLPLHSPIELSQEVMRSCIHIVNKRIGETITIKGVVK